MFGILITSLFVSVLAENWAVLVAGSKGYINYRHQSDIYHAYKILIENGFDPEKIIVMAYDDIAQSSENPFPGHVYNKPDGPDVYIGSDKIDYREGNCTVDKFSAVLKGDAAAAGGKVLNSTENDNVFIYFDDHGGPNVFAFPTGKMLFSNDIYDLFNYMHENHKYKNLLFYVEACYSGSMFKDKLSADYGIYAVTASNEAESSWGCFCEDERYKTCLSNEFSQSWMVDTETHNISEQTLAEQFKNVKANTTDSHVSEYGDLNINTFKLARFFSDKTDASKHTSKGSEKIEFGRRIRQEDVYLHYLELLAKENKFGDAAVKYNQELVRNEKYKAQAKKLANFFGIKYPSTFSSLMTLSDSQMKVYRRAIEAYTKRFGELNELNFWSHTVVLYNAVGYGALDDDNFASYEKLLKKL